MDAPELRNEITALREHPRRAGRYIVELDGSAVGAVSVETIAELKLALGRRLDAAQRAGLESATRRTACYDRALDTLARRARSRADLGRWLKEKEFTPAEIEPTLEKLAALGLLDDHAFALGFARSRMTASRGYGPRRIAAELARRGVSRAIIDAVLTELKQDDGQPSEIESALQAAEKKRRAMRSLDPQTRQRRLHGYLARRGFSADAIRAALRAERSG